MSTFSDIDKDFLPTNEGDINILEDIDSINQSIRNIILTPIGARTIYDDPQFGSGVNKLLFEKANDITALLLENEISNAISNFEPRVNIISIDINVDTDGNFYSIDIKYNIVAINIENTLIIDINVLK